MLALMPEGPWPLILLATSFVVLLVLLIARSRRGIEAREDVSGSFGGLRDELARAAEEGGSLHIALGSGSVAGGDATVSFAGIRIASAVAGAAIAYGMAPTMSVGDPTLLPLAQDALRSAYWSQGAPLRYNADHVLFIAPSPTAFAAGAGNVIAAQGARVTVVAGAYGAEVTLVTNTGVGRGLPQFVAVASSRGSGASYPVTDCLAPGEALYATAAQQSEDRQAYIGLAAQDVLRVLLVAAILVASLWALAGG